MAERIKKAIDAVVAIAPAELQAKPKKQGACSASACRAPSPCKRLI